jgi:acetylornithine/succinyldiaminopimelate/putrescine aminotransferase
MNNRQLFLQHVAQTSPAPLMLEIAYAEGMYLYDTSGKKYMDLIAGIGVSSVGHRHPKVIAAAKAQLDQYLHTLVYGEFVLNPQVALATALVKQLPAHLDSVYFVNSGAEATEGAMKLAKRFTNRSEIIATYNAYHGSTQGAMSLNSDAYFTQAYRPLLPNIRHIEFNQTTDLEHITTQTAAVIIETVKAESGIHTPQNDYLKALETKCREVGALLILDEIQAGYGRTGTLWAFEQYGVEPDVLLLAKGMGGGMPIGAFVASKQMMNVFTENPVLGHITTFGGHPVSCAAALATLETIVESDWIAAVKSKEALFHALLVHDEIKAVRSAGLWLAVELRDFDYLLQVMHRCLDKGLITDWFLFNNRSLRIAPPLNISEAEIRWACQTILSCL